MQPQIACNAQHHTCCSALVLCAEERYMLPAAINRPSKHLWLGNMQLNVNKSALEAVFGNFGTLERKTYAFVNFANMEPAVEAMRCLDGQPLLSITGGAMQLAVLVLHMPMLHHAVLSSASPCRAIERMYDRKLSAHPGSQGRACPPVVATCWRGTTQGTVCAHAGQKPLLVRYQAGEGEAPEGPMTSLLGSPAHSTSPRIGGGLVTLFGNGAGLQGSPPRSLTSPPGSSGLITPQRAQVRHAGLQP